MNIHLGRSYGPKKTKKVHWYSWWKITPEKGASMPITEPGLVLVGSLTFFWSRKPRGYIILAFFVLKKFYHGGLAMAVRKRATQMTGAEEQRFRDVITTLIQNGTYGQL